MENLNFSLPSADGVQGGAVLAAAAVAFLPLTVSTKSKTDTSSGDEEMQPERRCIALLPRCSTSVDFLSHSSLYDMCHKVSANMHHYGHVFQEIASPLIARYSRWRSRSQTRGEELPSGDLIELCHLNGFFLKAVHDGDRGHKFVAVVLQTPTWCDACGRTVLGVYRRFLRCKFCCYTCHVACRSLVNILCPDVSKSEHQSRYHRETSLTETCSGTVASDEAVGGSDDTSSTDTSISCSSDNLDVMISRFNDNKHGLVMELVNDDFKGFIRVHLNLCRPISMCLSARPPSIYDILTHSEPTLDYRQLTCFYLPRDTSTVLHIKDTTTVQDVITILLQKFNITDDPRKFCLYHRSQKNPQNNMRKLGIYELPLVLCLYWTSQEGSCGLDLNKFVLQENDTGDIMWDVFSIPELENFMTILNREEEEYLERLKSKYTLLRIHMQRRLKQLRSENNIAERKNVLDCL